MLLMCCKEGSWNALRYAGNNLEGYAGIHLLLCRQFELARAVRDGVRPRLIRRIEGSIPEALHSYFAKISGIGFRKAPVARCDICQLIETTKRVARSDYSREFMTFLNETRDNEVERFSRSMTEAFEKYIAAIGSGKGGRSTEQVARATMIMQKIYDLFLASKNEIIEAHSSDKYLEDMAETIASLHDRIIAVEQERFRIVH